MPATEQEQDQFLKSRMKEYFSQLAAISQKYPPPGTNASNGFWRNETLDDPKLKELEGQPPIELSAKHAELQKIFSSFQSQLRAAFNAENYESEWNTNLKLFWDVFKEHAKDILDVVVDIYSLFSDNKEKQEAAKKKVFDDIENLVKKIEDSGTVSKGTHANGNISVGAHAAATAAKNSLDQKFPKGDNSTTGKMADALRVVCNKILALKTDDHKPWLRAEWQASFQGITLGAAEGLSV